MPILCLSDKMNQSSKNYNRLLSPKQPCSRRENGQATRSQYTVTYRSDQVTSNFRMVVVAIMMIFMFCVLLFLWNIALWRELVRLQNDFATLRQSIEKTSLAANTGCDVIDTSMAAYRRERVVDKRHGKDLMEGKQPKWMEVEAPKQLLKREKRNALKDVDDSSLQDQDNAGRGLLVRVNRQRSSKEKNRKKKRIRKGRQGRSGKVVKEATALHVRIDGRIPYQGRTVDDRDGIIHSWDRNNALAQGFNVRNVNNGGVEIQKEGIYFIYSQVTFKIDSGVQIHEKIMTGTTVSSELSSCSNPVPKSDTSDYVTCYSSGIKKLRVNDRIQVKVHPSNLVVFPNPAYTYFGAFLIHG